MPKGLPWFRYYSATLNSAKVQTLSDKQFRGWVGTLCIASECDGQLPDITEIAFRLRMKPSDAGQLLLVLKRAKLLDTLPDGSLSPHDWDEHQYVSDNSTERVRKHRQKRLGNVSVTASEQNRAETEQSRNRGESDVSENPTPIQQIAIEETRNLKPRYEPLDEASGPSLVESTLDNLREQYDVAGFLIGDIAMARGKLERILGSAVHPQRLAENIKRSLAAHIVHWKVLGKGKELRYWLQNEEYLSTPAPPGVIEQKGPQRGLSAVEVLRRRQEREALENKGGVG